MALFDKIGEVAKNIGDRAGDAVETTKLNARIASEKSALGDDLKKIGAFYYERFAAGEPMPEGVLIHCKNAKIHYDAIADAQSEIERIKAENEAAKASAGAGAPAGACCAACGAALEPGNRFCSGCGAKVEAPPRPRFCIGCGAPLEPGARFCVSCGQKTEG